MLRARVHALLDRLLKQHSSPSRLAAAVFVGCVVGCSPFWGLHLPICIALAFLLRLNQVAVYAAANISIPPLAPVLGFACVQLGGLILRGRLVTLALADVTTGNVAALAAGFFVDWLVGGLALGAGIGSVAALLTHRWLLARAARQETKNRDPIGELLDAAGRRYDRAPRHLKWYARMKYGMDPCYREILALVQPQDRVVDLGSGLGMLPLAIGLFGEGRSAIGIEWDAAKVAAGVRALQGVAGAALCEGDLRSAPIPDCDVVTLVDVLHYFDDVTQRDILRRAAGSLSARGRILIREADPAAQRGASLTRLGERLVTRLGWNRGLGVHFRPIADLSADLEQLGLTVSVRPLAGELHPGNVLIVAARRPAS